MQIVVWFFSFVIFVAGLLMMGYSFEMPGYELVMFLGGILVISLAVAIPTHVLKWLER
jgi:hypothetical protein